MEQEIFIRAGKLHEFLENIDSIYECRCQLHESTYTDLETNVKNFRPKTKKRQYATDPIRVAQMDIIPYVGTNSLMVKTVVNGSTGRKYNVILTFYQIEYEDQETPNNVTFTASDGRTYHILPIQLNKSDVRVRCQCLDFYYRFAWYNHVDKSLYGPRPKPYVRKTDWFPPANPLELPAMCKHIIKTFQAMRDAHFFANQ